jgi:predicted DNA-binding transcriptional regulator YafY
LLQLIDRPSGITADDAAQELGYTRRTIFRDLRVLQDAGFPIYTERAADGHRMAWKVVESFRRNLPLKMTLAEVVALVMSRELLAPLGAGVRHPAHDLSIFYRRKRENHRRPAELSGGRIYR